MPAVAPTPESPERSSALSVAPSTKQQLVMTAERLFALHGIGGVSLRQISAKAGTANNSAVQYHFGSKESLIQAIFEYRLPRLARRRNLLQALASSNGGAADLRACVESYLLPLVEEAETEDSYYLSFLVQLENYSQDVHPFDRLPDAVRAPTMEFRRRVSGFLVDLPEAVAWSRSNQVIVMCLYVSAHREHQRRRGETMLPYGVHVADLFEGLVGFLRAPTSAEVGS